MLGVLCSLAFSQLVYADAQIEEPVCHDETAELQTHISANRPLQISHVRSSFVVAKDTKAASVTYKEIGSGFCYHGHSKYSGYELWPQNGSAISVETCKAICSKLDWCIAVAHVLVSRNGLTWCDVSWYWTEGQRRLMPLSPVADQFQLKEKQSICQQGSNQDWKTWTYNNKSDLLCDPNQATFCYDGMTCTEARNLCRNCDSSAPPDRASAGSAFDATCFSKEASECSMIFKQCGGENWNGSTCCEGGTACVEVDGYYSHCMPISNSSCAAYSSPCGGENYFGPTTCCIQHQKCEYVDNYTSMCTTVDAGLHTEASS